MAGLWIGTSGWVYRHWVGVFYPRDLRSDEYLPFYAQRFATVEVNFSFYRLPERTVFEAWRRQTPPGFVFAVKGSRFLTHMKKLKDPEEPLERLMDHAAGLQEKLGPVLFQLPPNSPANVDRLGRFLEALRRYEAQRFAFEFRHPSWLTSGVYDLLERARVALCLPVAPHLPLDVRLTTTWSYIRMHGGRHGVGYGDDELAQWADRIRTFLGQGAEVYVYFNNDPEGHAIHDAERLRKMLAVAGAHTP
jgi:uncharacterized protein YecE (DUF72 family)